MGVILATGITSLEVALEAEGFKRCYNRSVIMDVVKEWKSEIVILSPYLNGAEDIITEVVVPLREEGIRIIFLPGSTKDTEAIEWVKKLIPWGVYCYIFDPVTTDKIKDRINNPGRIKDLPHAIQEAIPVSLGESRDLIDDVLEDLLEVPEEDSKPSFMDKVKGSFKGLRSKDPGGKTPEANTGINEETTAELPQTFGTKIGTSGNEPISNPLEKDLPYKSTSIVNTLSRRVSELENDLDYDPLTKIYSRRYFETWINNQMNKKEPLSIIMIDIDRFKSVNDTYGHSSGDIVLSTLGSFFTIELKGADVPARFGGEEFVIGLPNTTASEAFNVADRLRITWGDKDIPVTENRIVNCTFSAGVAEWDGVQSKEALIDEADNYLYKAKNSGRNKVCGVENKTTIIEPKNIVAMSTKSLSALTKYKIVSVWNNCGTNKASTALELARLHKDIALLEFDVINPELDRLINIPNPSVQKSYNKDYWDVGAGLLTFPDMDAVLASKLLYKYKWGIDYLPAGNRLGVNEIAYMDVAEYEKLIDIVSKNKVVIMDLPTDLNNPITKAGIKRSEAVLVPVSSDFTKEQAAWLCSIGINAIQYFPERAKRINWR